MTEFEKNQPNEIFSAAGHKAANMLIDISNNPYSTFPHKALWEKGWNLGVRLNSEYKPYHPFTPKAPNAQTKYKPKFTQQVGRGTRPATQAKRPVPVDINKLASRFNSRNQTAR